MAKRLFPLLLLIFLSSCATIFTKKTYEMEIRSATYTKVKVYDSVFNLPAKVKVNRSKEALDMVFISDTVSKNHLLKASLSPNFLYGNLCIAPIGAGYLIDLTTPKRFYYGKSISLNTNDTLTEISRKNVSHHFSNDFDTNAGQLNVLFSLPWINSFHFKPMGETTQNNTGFLGIGIGVEYFYKEKNYVGLYGSAVINFLAPVPVPIAYDGEHDFLSSLAIGLTNNHKLERFTVGYGLNYSRNTWKLWNEDYDPLVEGSRKPIAKSNNSLGLIANSYYQFGKKFFVGLNYKPSLLTVNNNHKLTYEHVISLEFVWKFKIKQ